jgi:type IX secretion system PorP/SprF family membrane protein
MKGILILVIAVFGTFFAKAQDEMIFSHYIMNPVLVNPAASGFNNQHNFFLHYKNQWSGFTGAPRTNALSYNGPIGDKLGIGGFISNENVSNMNRFRGLLSYAFRFNINDFKGGLGLSTEFKRMSLNNDISASGLYKQGDNVAEQYLAGGVSYFDATTGMYGTYMDKFIISIAMPNLIQARLSQIDGGTTSRGGLKYFNLMMGYKQSINEITIEPSILVQRMIDAPLRIDLNLKGSFLQDKVIGAATYHAGTGGGLGVMIGTKFNGLTFAYSYDYALQRFQQYSTGAHEISIGYSIGRKRSQISEVPVEQPTSFLDRPYNN